MTCFLFQRLRYIPTRRATDPTPAVDSAAAEIEVINRRFVVRPARDRAHKEELIEHKLTVVEVAFGQAIGLFEVKRSYQFTIYD